MHLFFDCSAHRKRLSCQENLLSYLLKLIFKSVDIFDLSDYRNDIAFSESVFRADLYRCLILSFQSDNIQLIVFPKSKFFNTLSARASGYTYLPDLYAVIQMD